MLDAVRAVADDLDDTVAAVDLALTDDHQALIRAAGSPEERTGYIYT